MGELRSALRPTSSKINFVRDGRSTVVHPFGLRRARVSGTRLIRQSFVNQLNGAVRLSFDPTGVVCEIDVPLAAISTSPAS
jgi:hypothetical protein